MLTVKDNRVYVGPDLVGVFSSPEAARGAEKRFYWEHFPRLLHCPALLPAECLQYHDMLTRIACLPQGPRAHREAP